ncbi:MULTISPECIES: hypothetical protein [Burkholderia]|nr:MULTISPECIES: hypothetical protein [Burkholderia]
MLELIEWIRTGEIVDKLTSPLFLACAVAFAVAGYYCAEALSAAQRQGEE